MCSLTTRHLCDGICNPNIFGLIVSEVLLEVRYVCVQAFIGVDVKRETRRVWPTAIWDAFIMLYVYQAVNLALTSERT